MFRTLALIAVAALGSAAYACGGCAEKATPAPEPEPTPVVAEAEATVDHNAAAAAPDDAGWVFSSRRDGFDGDPVPHDEAMEMVQNAIDEKTVDIFFALFVPEEQREGHLKTLATVARKLSDKDTLKAIRRATTRDDIITALG